MSIETTNQTEEREWVGLTDEEIEQCIAPRGGLVKDLARAIEAKLKEKNHVS
jgi:hypothetical protein